MRNRGNGGFIWFIFFILLFSGGLGVFLPMFLIVAVVMAITLGAVKTSNRQDQIRNESYRRADNYYRQGQSESKPHADAVEK